MATPTELLVFMHTERTDSWIARQSGIPRSTLGFVRRGERSLPGKYTRALQSIYQQETYRRFTDYGIPKRISFTRSGIDPDGFFDFINDYTETVKGIAVGHTGAIVERMRAAGEWPDAEEIYNRTFTDIFEALGDGEISWSQFREAYGKIMEDLGIED